MAIGYGSSKARAEALAASLRAENCNAMAVEIDVCDRASVRAALERVRQRIGAPDTLVLCAGVAQQKLFQDISDADWDRLFDVNVKGVYRCAQEALPEMLRRGRGCIVTVASMWGEVGASCDETGWRAVLNEPVEEKEEDMTLLPDIVQGDELPVKGCGTEQKQTRPRPLHTESSLLAAMETAGRELSDEAEREAMKDAGIGTPATRAAIIETLFAREYVRREKKSLVPTDKGLAVYAVVRDKKIADVAMTGGWELALSKIATGEMDAPTFHRGIEVFASQIAKELLEARIDGAESDTACPRCGRPVVFYPKLAKCQNPDCGLTVWRTVARKELTDKQLAELLTKGKTGTIRGFVKNGGGTFDAALTLDDQFKTSFVFEPRDTPRQGKRNKRK